MRRTELGFFEGFTTKRGKNNDPQRVFDWDKAAQIIKDKLEEWPLLVAEAGLQGDWDYIAGQIFDGDLPVIPDYSYLSSNRAVPTLALTNGVTDEEEFHDCWSFADDVRFTAYSEWDEESLLILGLPLKEE